MVSIMPGMESRAPERTETSKGRSLSPSFLPTDFSTFASAASTSASSPRRISALVLGKIGADFGRDREPGRNWQTDSRHLGEIGAFPPEQRLHVAGAVRFAITKVINAAGGPGRFGSSLLWSSTYETNGGERFSFSLP